MTSRAARPIYVISWANLPPRRVCVEGLGRRQPASIILCASSPLAGMALAEVMRECDLGKSALDRWIQRVHECGPTSAADNRTFEQNRLIELDREHARLKMEGDVLKQAALISAGK